jgi:hypothetical protein
MKIEKGGRILRWVEDNSRKAPARVISRKKIFEIFRWVMTESPVFTDIFGEPFDLRDYWKAYLSYSKILSAHHVDFEYILNRFIALTSVRPIEDLRTLWARRILIRNCPIKSLHQFVFYCLGENYLFLSADELPKNYLFKSKLLEDRSLRGIKKIGKKGRKKLEKYLRIDDGWVTVEIKYPPSEINIPYLNSIVWRDKSCYYNPEHDVWINRRDFVNYGDLVKSQLGKKFRFTSFKSFYRKIRKVWKIPNGYTIYLVFRQQTDSGGSKSLILQV